MVPGRDATAAIRRRFELLAPVLDERTRRLVAAAESLALGWGGAPAVWRATGVARRAIATGGEELSEPQQAAGPWVRRSGGGRKKALAQDPTRLADLERLVGPVTRGHPAAPLRGTGKSVRKLADELNRTGHTTRRHPVADLLRDLGYRPPATRKRREGARPPDRDAQFRQIKERAPAFQASGEPVISVDTTKKGLGAISRMAGARGGPCGRREEAGGMTA
jgi:hypothetical protein